MTGRWCVARAVGAASLVALTTSGCLTPLGSACAEALGEVAVQTCSSFLTSLCNEELGTSDDSDDGFEDETAPRPIDEAPPPEWTPAPGVLACAVSVDDAGTHVSCADGTRARFDTAALGAQGELALDAPTTADDACRGNVHLVGLDDNGDNALGPTEITGRTLTCDNDADVLSPTLYGNSAIHSPNDVERLAGRRALSGGLTVLGPAVLEVALPTLRSMGGTLRVTRAPLLRTLALPALTSIGGDVSFTAVPVTRLGLPGLRHVGGAVVVTDNPALPQAELESVVRRLTRNGFDGAVVSGGNAR